MSPTQRILSLAFANSVGFSATTAMALWITTIDQVFPVPSYWGSVVGSLQLGAAALANLLAPYFFRRICCEKLVKGAAAMAAISAFLMAISPLAWLFAASAIGLGLAFGIMLSGSNALLARSHSVQGNYATAQICEVVFSSSFYFLAGTIIAAFGLRGIFVILMLLAITAMVPMHRLSLQEQSPRDAIAPSSAHRADRRAVIAAVAFVLFFVGQAAFYQHQVAIGKLLGISQLDMSRLLAIATVGGILGAASSKLVGVRFGVIKPIIVTTTLLAVVLVLGVRTDSKLVFALCAIFVQGLTMGTVPYAFTILATLDPTGRLASRGPALLLIGVAGGPVLAETFLRIGGYNLVGIVGSVLVLIAGTLFFVGARILAPAPTMATVKMVVPPA